MFSTNANSLNNRRHKEKYHKYWNNSIKVGTLSLTLAWDHFRHQITETKYREKQQFCSLLMNKQICNNQDAEAVLVRSLQPK